MPNRLHNWKYKDVTRFLKEKNFTLIREKKGSHEFWLSEDGQSLVGVNKTKGSYPIRTLETMIRQSDIPKKDWLG